MLWNIENNYNKTLTNESSDIKSKWYILRISFLFLNYQLKRVKCCGITVGFKEVILNNKKLSFNTFDTAVLMSS